ncbi:MAG: creatininase family protein [Rhodobacteraceae bacterium]|jgi:creatinine amidohydrolase|nr:creatininase family protein [Paracoccaceae bacterium]
MSKRDLAKLTWMEIRDLPKDDGVVVVPFGSLEQHGPHMSIDTDLYFADRFLDLALEKLPEEVACWRLPILPVSRSVEHVGFPGSLWLTSETLLKVIEEMTAGLAASGFRRVVFLNCHGGNLAILEVAARDVRIRTGMMVFTVFPPALMPDPVEIDDRERVYGIHANDWETSVMLALSPERVRKDLLDVSYPSFQSDTLRLEQSAANVAWTSRDLSKTGTFGDARGATAERGWQRIGPMIDRLAGALTEISTFELSPPQG